MCQAASCCVLGELPSSAFLLVLGQLWFVVLLCGLISIGASASLFITDLLAGFSLVLNIPTAGGIWDYRYSVVLLLSMHFCWNSLLLQNVYTLSTNFEI